MALSPVQRGVAWLSLSVAAASTQANTPTSLDELVVTSSRSGTQLSDSPQVVTVITREQIEQQLKLASDSSRALANLLPAYTPNREKMTGSGETFRGRKALFLIDGVPQSNPLRSTGRAAHTIDLAMVERIEVIHGANAIHGLGATGGIINFITRRPDSDRVSQHASIQATAPTDDADSDTLGYKLNYRVEGTQNDFEYLVGATWEEQGVYTDANGDLVGVDNTQGDLMNSRGYDVFAKLGYWIDNDQNVEFEINRFEVRGKQDYVSVDGDRENGVPTTSAKGEPAGKAPRNQVLTTSLKYQHDDLYGMVFNAQAYNQQFEGRFGAVLTSTFQDPAIAPDGTLYDQSQAESDKTGAKFTLTKAGLLDDHLKLTGGLDLLKDTTAQTLVLTNRYWVPETDFINYAPFLQAEVKALDNLILNAGVRHEVAKLDVDTFQTVASANGVTVDGGSPDFDETLFNAGLVYKPLNWLSLFANYSEGFGMADVGRVLRGINQPDQDVDDFLDLQPVVTENREIGFRINYAPVDFEFSYYQSDSDLGSRLTMIDGTYFVQRQKTEIDGFEATLGADFNDQHRGELAYSRKNGKYDSDEDGRVDSKLDGLNIPPNRLTANWQARWNERLTSLVQASHAFDRTFDDPQKEFHGYTLVDASIGYRLSVGELSLAVANLFNEDYFTYYSQSAQVNDTRYFKGRGRTMTVGYALDF
ncbi:TonB-dependent receptor [Marinobacter salinexigens]|uniref:TonB-dependent receptor n=1 Tax=Marinobacter salinexigens TaxID=2919747 RepID=A0A5B0VE23_9GAMM|nr:TonB-dependent receptor [Marinobacter salinexigens]KAA1172822.1 TonB-dependent receptor [Marinobacter salinexigens]